MKNKGDKNIMAYLASEIQEAMKGDQKTKNVTVKYDASIFPIRDQRQAMRDLAEEGIIKIIKDYDSYLYEKALYDPIPLDPKMDSSKITYTIPAGISLRIIDENKLNKKLKAEPDKEVKSITKDPQTGELFVNGTKLDIGINTDHYHLLDMFGTVGNDSGVIYNEDIIEFFNSKGVSVDSKKSGKKERISKMNLNKKMTNMAEALNRYAKTKGRKLLLHGDLKKKLIQSVKQGKLITGWRINL